MFTSDNNKKPQSLEEIPDGKIENNLFEDVIKTEKLLSSIDTLANEVEKQKREIEEVKEIRSQIFALMAMFLALFAIISIDIKICEQIIPKILKNHPLLDVFFSIAMQVSTLLGFFLIVALFMNKEYWVKKSWKYLKIIFITTIFGIGVSYIPSIITPIKAQNNCIDQEKLTFIN